MPSTTEARLTLARAAEGVREGRLSSVDLVEACLGRIAARDGEIQAFAHLDADAARAAALEADRARAQGYLRGPLHGVPIAVKDNIDVAGMPCAYGAAAFAGRQPKRDAACVKALRGAGAVILGKTVTTEMAVMHPGPTRNPHAPDHTPGGSSSGSAAAVADGMVFGALGTQTNGSIIRPASFCGVVGYKPSFGLIPRTGMLHCALSLDTIGVFASTPGDAALLAESMMQFDGADPHARRDARRAVAETAASPPPSRPRLAFMKTAAWDRAAPDCAEGFVELVSALGDHCEEEPAPAAFDRVAALHRTVMMAELAANYGPGMDRDRSAFSATLNAQLEEGRAIPAIDYISATAAQPVFAGLLDEVFGGADAILTPAANGEAPKGREETGDPAFSTLWSYLGLPAVTLPLLTGAQGLPIGVQLVGGWGDDGRLLRTARWLMETLAGLEDDDG